MFIRRRTFGMSLAAALVVGAIAAAAAPARPLDPGYGHGTGGVTAPPSVQSHRYYHELDTPQFQPGQPTWPAHPKPASPVASPLPSHAGGGGDSTIWIIGIAAGALAAVLSGAGLSRHTRVRARRLSV